MAQYIKADLDEMVFSDRERRYGAYFLRKKYAFYLLFASLAVIVLFVMFSILPNSALFSGDGEVVEKREIKTQVSLEQMLEEEPEQEQEEEEPPPPPPPPPPPQLKQVAYKIPEPTPEEELPEEEEEIVEIKELEEAKNIGLDNVEGDDEGIGDWEDEGDGEAVVIVEKEPSSTAFIVVQEQPKERNLDDIQKAIGYPEVAVDAGIEGLIVARVLVDKKGNYKKHKITKKAHPILQEAVEKHIHKLKFTPAIQGGKPIAFWVNIPFRFRLQ